MHILGPFSHGSVRFARLAAPDALRDVVECVWTYESTGAVAEFVPPDLASEIIWRMDRDAPAILRGPQACGAEIAIPQARYVGARLKPGAVTALFRVLPREACGARIAIGSFISAADDPLHSLIAALTGLRRNDEPRMSVAQRALDLIARREGRIGVDDVVRAMGCSARHLRRAMTAESGIGPKTALRIARQRKALALLATTHARLADIALESGYGDQAHMARDFAAFMTPSPLRLRRMSAFAKTC
jgi:AraC-like DNA-binding protein